MTEFITYRQIDMEAETPNWLVIYSKRDSKVNQLSFVEVKLIGTMIEVDFDTTLIEDDDEQVEFEFEIAQYLVSQDELIMGEDGDYYLKKI